MAHDEGFEGDTLWKYGLRTFLYTFHPAATWGNGRVGSLDVAIDTKWLRENNLRPVTRLAPPGSSDEAGKLRWAFHDQDLAKLPDLTFSDDPGDLYADAQIKRNRLDPAHVKSLTVSSTLAAEGLFNYRKESMRDNGLRTAFSRAARDPGSAKQSPLSRKTPTLRRSLCSMAPFLTKRSTMPMRASRNYESNWSAARAQKKTIDIKDRKSTLPYRPYKDFNPRYPFASVDWVVQHPDDSGFIDKSEVNNSGSIPRPKNMRILRSLSYIFAALGARGGNTSTAVGNPAVFHPRKPPVIERTLR